MLHYWASDRREATSKDWSLLEGLSSQSCFGREWSPKGWRKKLIVENEGVWREAKGYQEENKRLVSALERNKKDIDVELKHFKRMLDGAYKEGSIYLAPGNKIETKLKRVSKEKAKAEAELSKTTRLVDEMTAQAANLMSEKTQLLENVMKLK